VYALYSVLLFFALLASFPAYFFKLRSRQGEKLHLPERLGFRLPIPPPGRPLVWIHAVSVGEVLSLQGLIGEIKARHPDWVVGFSTLTGTGRRMAADKIVAADLLFYIPLDFAWSVRRVFRRLSPACLVLAESEFWPRLLHEAGRRRIPVIVINGRISGRTSARLRRLRPLVRKVFAPITRFLVQTVRDRDRLEAAGIDPARIAVAGNLKCEVVLPNLSAEEIGRARRAIGVPPSEKLVIAGSIHPGEERLLLDAYRTARESGCRVRFILAPRHPEIFQNLERDFGSLGLKFQRKTRLDPSLDWDVLILDTIGDLARFYALSDAAFIGGSLVSRGGQNLLEPAFYGKPIFFGPHMDNFAALAETFVDDGAARIVGTPDDLAAMFSFGDGGALLEMGRRARGTLEALSGATTKTLAALEKEIENGRKES